ncbi:MAG: BamA/TamA family outer membrane protein, partial [Flavobacteriaceae bacterium]
DFIEIKRTGKNETNVMISRIIDGDKGEVILDRTFNRNITKELWIYGLDDDDVFEVRGKADNPIYIRIVGGQNNDTYRIKNGRRIRVYDHKTKKNTIEENNGAKIDFADTYANNLFDFNKNIVKLGSITPSLGFNPDDGFLLGISKIATTKGFHRNPFSTQHRIIAGYYFATNGFSLDYHGEFANLFGDWNLKATGKLTTENFSNNFFGYGNETVNNDDVLTLDYNRVKTSIYAASFGLFKRGDFGSDFGFKLLFEGINIGKTEDRFIETFASTNVSDSFYSRRYFTSVEANYNYASFDNKITPTRGMTFEANMGSKTEPTETKNTYAFLDTHIGFYNALSKNRKLVLKTDVRSQLRFGDDLIFYQASNIGGSNGLRGYRMQRFTGQHALVASTDFRYSFNAFKTKFLPLQIGVFTGADVGRVWLKNDASEKWHNDYGGGFWITAADAIQGTFNFFNSVEGLRFSFGFGLNF